MKNTHNLQIDVASSPCDASEQLPKTAHALDIDLLLVRIVQARQARATMTAALGGAPPTGVPTLAAPPPSARSAPFPQVHTITKPRKTAPCKMYARGRCSMGDACDFFHDPDALWTLERGGTWCWRYMAGVCSGQCKFRHPGPEEMATLMKHTPCVIATCPRIDCPRRHDDIDFDPEFQEKQYRVQMPRLHDSFAGNAPRTASLQYAPVTSVGTISPRERAEYAAALRRALRVQVSVPAVNKQPSETTTSRSDSPADSISSSGLDTVSTPATSRADAVDDWRARDADSEDRAAFPHTPGAAQTFAAVGRVNGKGHARRQSVWVKKEENDENDIDAGFKNWRGMGAKTGMGHARSQSWAPFGMRGTFP